MIEYIGKNKAKLIISMGSGKSRKRYSKTVEYKRKRDLPKMYQEFEAEVLGNPLMDSTVEDIINAYIENRRMLGIKSTTIKGYELCRDRISADIRREKAYKVSAYQLDKFVAVAGEKYAPKTVRNTMSVLSSAYDRAVRLGLLKENPCLKVTLPKMEQAEIKTFSNEEVAKFLRVLQNERLDFRVGYELCLLCGLRRSEVLGLKESDVSVPFRMVSVNKTRHIVDGKQSVQGTKTARSRRNLALPDALVDDIEALIQLHASYEFVHCDYLIQTGFGEPMHPATFTNHLSLIEEQNGLPHVSVHGLRHTFTTMLNANGVDIARISAELGHSNVSTTFNRYTHVFGSATSSSRGIADSMNRVLENSAPNLPLGENKKASER